MTRRSMTRCFKDDISSDISSKSVTGDYEVGPKTGLTANEKNTYQCGPERGSTRGHGRWS
ncbi:MAG: hypothetical protein IMF17_01580, partial [Proteobacteria bacterium]|nr:hypothetical protein [Pseudomonadota bacterium]